ncbi:MAG: SDR family NAD(P)-dependent oxidoreductase [Chloroflexota bacterium]
MSNNFSECFGSKRMGFIITGGASGIGLATAHLLHSKGKAIMLWDTNQPTLEEQSKLLHAPCAVVDVTDSDAVMQAMQTASEQLGKITGVVHCAGVAHVGMFEDLTIKQHQQVIDVNLKGTVHIAHAAIPYLKQTQGSLVLIASSSSFYGPPDFATYAATKSGVVGLAQALRLELEDAGVHVGVVAPHFTETPMLEESKKSPMFEGANYTSTADDIAVAIDQMIRLRKATAIPGVMNKLNYFLATHLPEVGTTIVRAIWKQGKRKRK